MQNLHLLYNYYLFLNFINNIKFIHLYITIDNYKKYLIKKNINS